MTITLNHTIVPALDKQASARFFAEIFGLAYEASPGHFAPVRVNPTLTLDFGDAKKGDFETHHYAFHVDDAEFDQILARVRAAGIAYGSDPWHLENRELNAWNGGRGVYFRDPNGHVLELLTQASPP
jgi:catechol 2,3-dioxygenase-like lactoylglutathione lyase family enzyme